MKIDAKKKISIGYILTGYVTVAANILLSIILMKKLSVGDFGMTSIGRTIFQSFEFSHFGIRYGFDRLLPGTEDHDKRLGLFWAGFLGTFLFSLLFVLFWGGLYIRSLNFYIFFIGSGLIYALIQLYRVYYRTQEIKTHFFLISIFSLLLPVIIQIVFFLFTGLQGMIIAMLLSYTAVFLIICYKFGIPLLSKKKELIRNAKPLFSYGYILFLTSILSFLVSSGDRILMERYWGVHSVGEYSIIMFVFSTLSIFPGNYTELIMSEIIRRKSLNYILKHCLILSTLTAVFCALSILIIPFAFSLILPQYLYLAPHMDLVVWAAIPFSVMSVLNYYLHSIDKRIYIFASNLFGTFIYLVLFIFILKAHLPIDYVLICKIAYFVLIAGLLTAFSFREACRMKKTANKSNFHQQ